MGGTEGTPSCGRKVFPNVEALNVKRRSELLETGAYVVVGSNGHWIELKLVS